MRTTKRRRAPHARAVVFACCAALAAALSSATLERRADAAASAPPSSPTTSRHAQSGKRPDAKATPAPSTQPAQLKRTTARQETRRMAYGGRLTVYGAPQGSLTIEAWEKGEVEIAAEVELSADTEEDLARLAAVNTFAIDDDVNHITVLSVGTHDRKYMKRTARDFPKHLLGLPWKIDYRIRVPVMTDLEIYAGHGALAIKGVEGAIRLNAGQSDPTTFTLSGGDLEARMLGGTVNLDVTARSWRGRGVGLRLVSGDLNLSLPPNFSGYVNAEILRTGRVENAYAGLVPQERSKPTERNLQGVAGSGGATLTLTVGDGTIRITQASANQ